MNKNKNTAYQNMREITKNNAEKKIYSIKCIYEK